MKKIFSLFAAVLFASSMMAAVITLDPATQTPVSTEDTQNGEAISLVINGIGVDYNGTLNAAGETAPADFRIFAGKTLTLSATVNITKVEIVGKANKANFTFSTDNGTVTTGASYSAVTEKKDFADPLIVVENINAKIVTMTAGKQLRAYTIRVTIDGESSEWEGGGQGGGGEEGDEVTISGLAYADAYFYNYNGTDYWDFDLYKNYNESTQATVYPEVYIIVEAESVTTIAGTYYMNYAGYWKSANDSVEIDENDYEAILTITFDGSEYTFSGQFVGDDGKTYKFECTSEVYAYDVDNDYDEITLEDEETQGIEDIVLTEKAQKVSVDGAVYVIRDNKMYNVTGTRVR